jgi:hypothetical protein
MDSSGFMAMAAESPRPARAGGRARAPVIRLTHGQGRERLARPRPRPRPDDRQWTFSNPMKRTDIRLPGSARGRGASALILSLALLGTVALGTGCASSQPVASPASLSPSAGPQPSPSASTEPGTPATASPGPSGTAQPATSARIRALAARYLAIARPANHRLEVAVDGFRDHRHDDLAKATADLRAQAATERHFDRQLAWMHFRPAIARMARALIRANRSRIWLTRREAQSSSLAKLKTFTGRHQAADAAVETWVKAIRQALGLPPPSTS